MLMLVARHIHHGAYGWMPDVDLRAGMLHKDPGGHCEDL